MTIIDSSKLSEKGGFQSGRGALDDPALILTLADYKRNVVSRYQLLKPDDIDTLADPNPFVATKLDGQMFFLVFQDGLAFLVNARGRVITGLPLLETAKAALSNFSDVLLAGELYCGDDEGRSRVYHVTAALGGSSPDLVARLRFGVFDVLRVDGKPYVRSSYMALIQWMDEHLPHEGDFHRIPFQRLERREVAVRFQKEVLDQGEEGLICYADGLSRIYKIKPRHNVDAVVIGFTEAPDEPGSIRVLLTALMRPDGSFQSFARVGTGFDTAARRDLFNLLAPLKRPSTYMETDRNHTMFTMIEPKHVIEIAFHDILVESGTGKPQIKAILNYDEQKGWTPGMPERFVNLISPVFVRVRDDKGVNPTDLRLTQLQELVSLDNLETGSRHVSYDPSEILKREVYTKVTKNKTSVRKLLYWQTNKHEVDPDYPPFVFCYVDYSPNRAQPLKRTLRIASTRQQAQDLFERFRDNEIKKGWQLHEG